jgi:hypothetical protein
VRAARLFLAALDDPDPGEAPLATAARWERAADLFEYGGHHLSAARAFVLPAGWRAWGVRARSRRW